MLSDDCCCADDFFTTLSDEDARFCWACTMTAKLDCRARLG